MQLCQILGIRVAATAVAWPTELQPPVPPGLRLDNREAWRLLCAGEANGAPPPARPEPPWDALGVVSREWVAKGSGCFELAQLAAERVLSARGETRALPEALLVATSTPPRITESLASRLGVSLGLTCPCVDVRAGGTGGLMALLSGLGWFGLGANSALIVAAETPSAYANPEDPSNALLFGDGAAALLLERSPQAEGLIGGVAGNATVPGRPFTCPGLLPPRVEDVLSGAFRMQRPDRQYTAGLRGVWTELIRHLRVNFPAECQQAEYFLPYAVSQAQVDLVAEALGVPQARLFHCLQEKGALGCASPLVGLHQLLNSRPATGARTLILLSVGGGASYVALIWRVAAINAGSNRSIQAQIPTG
jgi:3-oxoacyl-[acyl-carrier-protein] synthase-3